MNKSLVDFLCRIVYTYGYTNLSNNHVMCNICNTIMSKDKWLSHVFNDEYHRINSSISLLKELDELEEELENLKQEKEDNY